MLLTLLACTDPSGTLGRQVQSAEDPLHEPHHGADDACVPVTGPTYTARVEGDDFSANYVPGGDPHLGHDLRVTLVLARTDSRGNLLAQSLVRVQPTGDLDPTFGVAGSLPLADDGVVRWADDGGYWLHRRSRNRIERHHPDGSLDLTFGQQGISADLGDAFVGWLDVAGNPLLVRELTVVRLGPDGIPRDLVTLDDFPASPVGLSTGRIALIAGPEVLLFEADGAPVDLPATIPWGTEIVAAPDGGFYVLREEDLDRYDADGRKISHLVLPAPDGWETYARSLRVEPTGWLWVGGGMYATETGVHPPNLAAAWHLDPDGAPDPCVGEDGRVELALPFAANHASNLLDDGSIVFTNGSDAFHTDLAWMVAQP